METHEYHELLSIVSDLKERLKHLETVGTCKHPTIETAQLYGAKLGLPPDQVEWWFNFYQSNGWRVGKNPMKSWEAAMRTWKLNWQTKGLGVGTVNGNGHSPSMYDMKCALEAKERRAKELSDKYYNDSGAFHEWTNLPARTEFVALKKSIKELNAKIAGAL